MSRFEELPDHTEPATTTATQSTTTPPPPSQNTASRKVPKELDQDDEDEGDADAEDADTSVWWTPSELKDIIERSTALKVKGNAEFGHGQYPIALETYKEGLVELPVRTQVRLSKGKEKEKEEEDGTEEVRELRAILCANVAACCIKMERWKEAVEACNDALEDNPVYLKALSRRSLANESLSTWSSLTSALEDYKTMETLSDVPPLQRQKNKEALRRLPGLIEKQQEKEKDEVLGKLKELGNSVLGRFGLNTDMFKMTPQEGGGYSMGFER